MRVGLALPHYDFSSPEGWAVEWPALVETAKSAERLGFDSLWISDHFFLDLSRYGGDEEPLGTLEPFIALAALSPSIERARLGTLVAAAPFRHPAHVAKMATVIDLATGGRFDLGLGAGWYEREFDAFGYRFPSTAERFEMLEEYVQAIGVLFREGPSDFEGRHVRLAGAYNLPAPVQTGGPPIWIGGKGGDRLLGLVGRHAAGWNSAWRWAPETYGERVEALHRICSRVGRDPATVRLSVGLLTLVGEDERDLAARFEGLRRWAPGGALDGVSLEEYAQQTLTGTPEVCVKRLAQFAGLGVEEVIVSAASLPFAIFDWSMVELIAEVMIPEAARL